ncbi:hypothetical protein [Qipengyuania atrilutea]|uniref:Uncharacterized protein n=1 Tax=Qipengyuania atrilutea TaxID=2744473 RepID=A0A850H2U8_9SPHN|nr:hypothetical protein [Actirhodobacter atriluteus]NVD44910.1 hypothetical protein [Actirhodobacter atriluteus]
MAERAALRTLGRRRSPRDKYGRELRSARRMVSGTERFLGQGFLADHMLKRGLAGESGWGGDETDWCA